MVDNEEVTKRIDEQLSRYEDLSEAIETVGHDIRKELKKIEGMLIRVESALRRIEEGEK